MDKSEIYNHLGEDSVDEIRNALSYKNGIPFYTRGVNPTTKILE